MAILLAVTAIPGRGGYGTSGPRFVPLIVAIGLIALSAAFLLRTWVRPDIELAERSAEEDAATNWATPGLIMVALVVYAFALEPVGYPVATALVFVSLARILGSRALVRDVWRGSCSVSACSPRSPSTSGCRCRRASRRSSDVATLAVISDLIDGFGTV